MTFKPICTLFIAPISDTSEIGTKKPLPKKQERTQLTVRVPGQTNMNMSLGYDSRIRTRKISGYGASPKVGIALKLFHLGN